MFLYRLGCLLSKPTTLGKLSGKFLITGLLVCYSIFSRIMLPWWKRLSNSSILLCVFKLGQVGYRFYYLLSIDCLF